MAKVIYAVGDVHGRDDLLGELHGIIRDHHAARQDGREGLVVHVGDYVDRGPASAAVLDRVMAGVAGMESVCLMGNHEAMMLACTRTWDWQPWEVWRSNGGDATLDSLGVEVRFRQYDPEALCVALGPARLAWLRALPLSHIEGDYLFVHAGIAPGVPLEAQEARDLLWIRDRFLDSDADHGRIVVHGHTPGEAPVVRPNRIGLDTGAPVRGVLTAAVLDGSHPPAFLQARGRRAD
ncbi:metallophosphoesterase [Jannaschia formosa]|uniref:metallophosphoesterase n=1 Tax=Jannaschia formosa TaxID=2259592 RepID=UPI001431553E|nr:metallophosphoesterase [Jannaschia formosa]